MMLIMMINIEMFQISNDDQNRNNSGKAEQRYDEAIEKGDNLDYLTISFETRELLRASVDAALPWVLIG